MNIKYDPEIDALYVQLTTGTVIESEQVEPGIVLDFDDAGKVIGVEMLSMAQYVSKNRPEPMRLAA